MHSTVSVSAGLRLPPQVSPPQLPKLLFTIHGRIASPGFWHLQSDPSPVISTAASPSELTTQPAPTYQGIPPHCTGANPAKDLYSTYAVCMALQMREASSGSEQVLLE